MSDYDNRFSVTALDGYRYYKTGYLPIEDYVRRLKRIEKTSPRAELGINFHQFLEHGNFERMEQYFDLSRVNVNLQKPDATELMIERIYTTPEGRRIRIRGKVDAIAGTAIIDYKTTKRAYLESYSEAYQWRTYLSIYPSDRFRYEVFILSEKPSLFTFPQGAGANRRAVYRHIVYEHERLTLRPYRALESDVLALISEYDDFLQRLEEWGYIELTPEGVKPGVAQWQVEDEVMQAYEDYDMPEGESPISNVVTACEIVEGDYIRVGVYGSPGESPSWIARLYTALSKRWPDYAVYVGLEMPENFEENILLRTA